MAEENEEQVDTPKEDEVVEEIKEDLKEGGLTVHDLEALETKLTAHIRSIQTDNSKDAEEKEELKAKLDKLQEHLDRLIEAQEERDKKHNDESTIVVPPKELDPPTHQNRQDPDAQVQQENQNKPPAKHKLRWW